MQYNSIIAEILAKEKIKDLNLSAQIYQIGRKPVTRNKTFPAITANLVLPVAETLILIGTKLKKRCEIGSPTLAGLVEKN